MREQLFFLAEFLSPYHGGCPDPGCVAAIDWRYVTFLAGCNLVTPSLAFRVAECGLMEEIPREVADELREIAANVGLRNQRFRAQLAEITAAFDAAALSYAVLKGGAYLVLPVYPAPSLRVMGDLDLLVAKQDLDEARGVLEGLDYYQVEDESLEDKPGPHRHLSPFVSDRHIAAVEIHRAALPVHLAACAPGDELLRRRHCHRADGQDYFTLSATHRVLVLIMHSEIIDGGNANGVIALRSLEEYAYTAKVAGDAIDWLRLEDCFARVGRLQVLMSFLWLANRLFGVPLPEALLRHGLVRAKLHYLRCLLQIESRQADRWLRRWFRYSGTSSLDRLGVEPGLDGRGRQRLHAMKRVWGRRLRRR